MALTEAYLATDFAIELGIPISFKPDENLLCMCPSDPSIKTNIFVSYPKTEMHHEFTKRHVLLEFPIMTFIQKCIEWNRDLNNITLLIMMIYHKHIRFSCPYLLKVISHLYFFFSISLD